MRRSSRILLLGALLLALAAVACSGDGGADSTSTSARDADPASQRIAELEAQVAELQVELDEARSGGTALASTEAGVARTDRSGRGDEICGITLRDQNASVAFRGDYAEDMCFVWQRYNGDWIDYVGSVEGLIADPSLGIVCTGDFKGIAWVVLDTGAAIRGGWVCGSLNEWAHGGELHVP